MNRSDHVVVMSCRLSYFPESGSIFVAVRNLHRINPLSWKIFFDSVYTSGKLHLDCNH